MAGRERHQPDPGPQPDAAERADAAPDAAIATGRYAYGGLQRVIHERARLSILSSLASNPQGLAFNDLKQLCHLTDGNLSRQLQLLQEGAFVEATKSTRNNRPHTQVVLTETGRERFLEYIAVLESVVADAVSAKDQAARPIPLDRLRGAAG
jgi:DNA-binding MarR family transcriptional regulator